ncbi:hypothetical protein DRQ25_05270 [Candidatus Fermentibacteria bacterium]|nr:MAG: hypothetical protein DRQ25_05270 [Candidatus Fermentibacteria bacterium]
MENDKEKWAEKYIRKIRDLIYEAEAEVEQEVTKRFERQELELHRENETQATCLRDLKTTVSDLETKRKNLTALYNGLNEEHASLKKKVDRDRDAYDALAALYERTRDEHIKLKHLAANPINTRVEELLTEVERANRLATANGKALCRTRTKLNMVEEAYEEREGGAKRIISKWTAQLYDARRAIQRLLLHRTSPGDTDARAGAKELLRACGWDDCEGLGGE